VTCREVRERARRLARRAAPATGVVVLGFAVWTHITAGNGVLLNPIEFAAVLAVFASASLVYSGHEGWAFAATTLAMAPSVLSIFVDLYPRVMVSSTSSVFDLTVHNTASGPYSLKVMTVVVLLFLPFVTAYQNLRTRPTIRGSDGVYGRLRQTVAGRALSPVSPARGGAARAPPRSDCH
jgi:cytochrome d ubiquinol oxidase subunit II